MSFFQKNIRIILICFSIIAFVVFYLLSLQLFDTSKSFNILINPSLGLIAGDEIMVDDERVGSIKETDTIKGDTLMILAKLTFRTNLNIPNQSYIEFNTPGIGQEKLLKLIFVPSRGYYDKNDTIIFIDLSARSQKVEESISKAEDETKKPFVADTVKQQVEEKKNKDEIIFKVQFKTSPVKITSGSTEFKGIKDVNYYIEKDLYKYTTGSTSDFAESIKYCEKVKSLGFADAFVVAFRANQRISIKEAKQLINK